MNKIELPGIMICQWDAETKTIIVSPEQGYRVTVNHPISEAHASMVTMEVMDKTNPDERKPHQLKEHDAVECTPEEREEILRIAVECGVKVYGETLNGTDKYEYPNIGLYGNKIAGCLPKNECFPGDNWHTVPDFIAKIKGEYKG